MALGLVCLVFFGSACLPVLWKSVVNPTCTPLMSVRSWQSVFQGQWPSVQRGWKRYREIPDHLKLAVIAAEDQQFVFHDGFDWRAIRQAWEERKTGKRRRGASTLSQQVAKNLFLWPHSDFLRKGLEVWFTFWLERFCSKRRILELYLNLCELGPGVYGVESGANYHFAIPVEALSVSQSTQLAAYLPRPLRYRPGESTAYITRRKRWIRFQMRNLGTEALP